MALIWVQIPGAVLDVARRWTLLPDAANAGSLVAVGVLSMDVALKSRNICHFYTVRKNVFDGRLVDLLSWMHQKGDALPKYLSPEYFLLSLLIDGFWFADVYED